MKFIAAVAAVMLITCISAAVAWASDGLARDGAIIRNTGSTNVPGYVIKLWSDGTAQVFSAMRGGQPIGPAQSGRVSLALAQTFFSNLKAAKSSGQVAGQSCMKSTSFGSATVVQYHGWSSADLECPGDGFVVSLGSQAHEIAAALGVPRTSTRRSLLPNEPRRVPAITPSQASPTPE
ncbi:MAG TPA: hypothetical protein VFE17_09890 [Candidatus Baltobacteraceae bacterium]|jgi:hypothetical protein|nr:hypothetical protein [Candidatus Baltobacteraceae bacterium]